MGDFSLAARARSSTPATRSRSGARRRSQHPPHWFAAAESAATDSLPSGAAVCTVLGKSTLSYRSATGHAELDVDVRVPGWHNRANLAAAIAGATELGVPLAAIAARIPELQLPGGRYDRLTSAAASA